MIRLSFDVSSDADARSRLMIRLSIDVSSDACDSTLASASVVLLNEIKQHTEYYIATSVNCKKGIKVHTLPMGHTSFLKLLPFFRNLLLY